LLSLQQGEFGVREWLLLTAVVAVWYCALGVAAHLLSKRFLMVNFPVFPNQRRAI
jgi:hypothetical protein